MFNENDLTTNETKEMFWSLVNKLKKYDIFMFVFASDLKGAQFGIKQLLFEILRDDDDINSSEFMTLVNHIDENIRIAASSDFDKINNIININNLREKIKDEIMWVIPLPSSQTCSCPIHRGLTH